MEGVLCFQKAKSTIIVSNDHGVILHTAAASHLPLLLTPQRAPRNRSSTSALEDGRVEVDDEKDDDEAGGNADDEAVMPLATIPRFPNMEKKTINQSRNMNNFTPPRSRLMIILL